ncbi:hypothetical protein FHP25_25035 [Vineibacter terrae]|uniref:Uncharacterized protein n=1 Tax=Vineibacter terrae TaxID=2586908 RepID=A0A5C8PGZ4_9HYPH|nr:hypothetical protein [Vineibacter terrae]TXL72564.1 hypothetical protein FHP25_25035 [Vineibacter terrae]
MKEIWLTLWVLSGAFEAPDGAPVLVHEVFTERADCEARRRLIAPQLRCVAEPWAPRDVWPRPLERRGPQQVTR